jgi:phosphate uptake regulator
MKRRIIKQGNNTLTITLPKQWTVKENISAGDEISIVEDGEDLKISSNLTKQDKSITINIDNLEKMALAKLLTACFEQEYDKIILNFSKKTIKPYSIRCSDLIGTINLYIGRMIGFEVTSQSSTSMVIEKVSERLTGFDNVLSRLFFLIEEYINMLIHDLKTEDYEDLREGEIRHENITKFVALASKMVSENNGFNKTETLNYFLIFNYMDKITDFIRYAYQSTLSFNKKVSDETIILGEKALDYLKLYRSFFYKFDYKKINELDLIRHELKKTFVKSSQKHKEVGISSNFDALVEILNGTIKSRISLELLKEKT